MARLSVLEPHHAFILAERRKGQRYSMIAESLNAQGCATNGKNVAKWFNLRIRRVEKCVADLAVFQEQTSANVYLQPPTPPTTIQPVDHGPVKRVLFDETDAIERAARLAKFDALIERTKTEDPLEWIMASRN